MLDGAVFALPDQCTASDDHGQDGDVVDEFHHADEPRARQIRVKFRRVESCNADGRSQAGVHHTLRSPGTPELVHRIIGAWHTDDTPICSS